MKLPLRGRDPDQVLRQLESFREGDVRWREGRAWAYVFDAGATAKAVVERAYTAFLGENALDPTVFGSALRLEREVLAMAAAHLGGDAGVAGAFTSGGTESIILAVKAARDLARSRGRGEHPKMVLPVTAHASFHKAGDYLGVEPVVTPVDPATGVADVAAMAAAVDADTALLVGSAPSYAHGVVDPIGAIAAIAAERDLPMHVDACMGGFLLPYFRRLGTEIEPFDFQVPGVTSISMDLHKYAFAAKGASVVLYRDRAMRRHQMSCCASWAGYALTNHTVQSSRSVGPLAAAWAVLQHLGDDGYLQLARSLRDATARIVAGVAAIDGLRVAGRPQMCLVAFSSSRGNVFRIADEMGARGWYVQPQLSCGGLPATLHLSIQPSNVARVDAMLADLAVSVDAAAARPPTGALLARLGEVGGDLGAVPPDDAAVAALLQRAGLGAGAVPTEMAEINLALDALPPRWREALLTSYLNDLYSQPLEER